MGLETSGDAELDAYGGVGADRQHELTRDGAET
jgi:hypothetical protein